MFKETKHWIKMPGPGQFKGEGNWFLAANIISFKFYQECKKTDYLPTFEGDEPPKDKTDETKEG